MKQKNVSAEFWKKTKPKWKSWRQVLPKNCEQILKILFKIFSIGSKNFSLFTLFIIRKDRTKGLISKFSMII